MQRPSGAKRDWADLSCTQYCAMCFGDITDSTGDFSPTVALLFNKSQTKSDNRRSRLLSLTKRRTAWLHARLTHSLGGSPKIRARLSNGRLVEDGELKALKAQSLRAVGERGAQLRGLALLGRGSSAAACSLVFRSQHDSNRRPKQHVILTTPLPHANVIAKSTTVLHLGLSSCTHLCQLAQDNRQYHNVFTVFVQPNPWQVLPSAM